MELRSKGEHIGSGTVECREDQRAAVRSGEKQREEERRAEQRGVRAVEGSREEKGE